MKIPKKDRLRAYQILVNTKQLGGMEPQKISIYAKVLHEALVLGNYASAYALYTTECRYQSAALYAINDAKACLSFFVC